MANAITQLVASKAITTLSLVSAKPLPPSVDHDTASLHFQRRMVAWGLAGAVLGLNENAWAAKRQPAAPAEDKEKKDPNVSGVLAKVLASKRRKEAMKEAMAKQRGKGKAIQE